MKQLILFLFINFGGLALGSYFMGDIAENAWYQSLEKAPWTPPGWVFGAAWFSIMLLYSIFMQQLLKTKRDNSKSIKWFFGLSVFFNVCWNPIFFVHHYVVIGLVFLIALFVLLVLLFRIAIQTQPKTALLLLPYLIWMFIAISLNAYFLF